MGRKRLVALIASITAVLAVAAIVTQGGFVGSAIAREQLRIETVLSVDDNGLTELAVGEGSLWSLDSVNGIVYEIKPKTNELGRVLETDAYAEALSVAGGRVWTAEHRKGYVTSTPLTGAPDDVRRFTVVPVADGENLRSSLRMHATTDRVWVAAGVERPAIALDSESVGGYPPSPAEESLTNLSAIGGSSSEVWGVTLDGRVARLSPDGDVEWDHRLPGSPKVSKVVVDGSGVWLMAEDRLLRVDSGDGKVREIDFDGVDIAVGEGLLWAVGAHHVEVFNSVTARSLGAIDIDEESLLNVAYLAHSGWVLGEHGKIFRVSMNDEPLHLVHPLQDDRLVYAYAADGDLWAEQVDGDDVNLVVSNNEDRRPSLSPDGKTIAFQRSRGISGKVYFLNLSNGELRFLGHGGWPTYGHSDGFAYVSRGYGVYGINFVSDRSSTFVPTGSDPANLSWGADDHTLYFVAGAPELRLPYRITIGPDGSPGQPESLAPAGGQPGASYPVATIGSDGRLFAVRACCRLPRAEIIYEFGYVDLVAPGRPFVPLLELTETGTNEPITLVRMGRLVPPALGDPQQWTEDGAALEDSWLLSDGYVVTYLFKDGLTWSFADQRLEHPGRGSFDGLSRAPDVEVEPLDPGEKRPAAPASPSLAPSPSPSP